MPGSALDMPSRPLDGMLEFPAPQLDTLPALLAV
jgi:hypothetical protein